MLKLVEEQSKLWLSKREASQVEKLSGYSIKAFSDPREVDALKEELLSAYSGDSPEERLMRHLISTSFPINEGLTCFS